MPNKGDDVRLKITEQEVVLQQDTVSSGSDTIARSCLVFADDRAQRVCVMHLSVVPYGPVFILSVGNRIRQFLLLPWLVRDAENPQMNVDRKY